MSTIGSMTDYKYTLAGLQAIPYPVSQANDSVGDPQVQAGVDSVQKAQFHHPHRGGLEQAVLDTLSQLGLTLPNVSSNPPSNSGVQAIADSSLTNSSTDPSSVRDHMKSFVYSLFQVIQENSQRTTPNLYNNPYASDHRSGSLLSTDLSTLMSVVTDGSGSGSSSIRDLENRFSALVDDINGLNPGAVSAKNPPSLELFIEILKGNLPETGGLISTFA